MIPYSSLRVLATSNVIPIKRSTVKNVNVMIHILALGVGLEPTTTRLTAERSTIELPQITTTLILANFHQNFYALPMKVFINLNFPNTYILVAVLHLEIEVRRRENVKIT